MTEGGMLCPCGAFGGASHSIEIHKGGGRESDEAVVEYPGYGDRETPAAATKPAASRICLHLTIVSNKKTGQARCYSCGKFLPNTLLSKSQQRIESFFREY